MPNHVSGLRENHQRPNKTVLTPRVRQAGTTSQQRSALPGHRQGHALAEGLKVLGGRVLTCRRPPGTESARCGPGSSYQGGKIVTIPLAPRTARAIDLAIGERTGGPVFLAADGRRLDRHGARRIVRRTARRAGIGKAVTPHTLRHAFITAALDAGVPLRDVQEAIGPGRGPRQLTRGESRRMNLNNDVVYRRFRLWAAPPASSRPFPQPDPSPQSPSSGTSLYPVLAAAP